MELFDEDLIPKISVPVIRAIQISDSDSSQEPGGLSPLDAPIAGSGQTFDWQLLADKQIEQDYFIVGGLTVDNVAEAKEPPALCLRCILRCRDRWSQRFR